MVLIIKLLYKYLKIINFLELDLKVIEKKLKNKKYDRDASIHPHQIHFEILSELGIVGYILFLSVFIFNIILAVNLFDRERNVKTLWNFIYNGNIYSTFTLW